MPHSRRTLLVALGLAFLQAGCAKESTRPAVTDVRLAVSAAPLVGSPSRPVTIDVRVTNIGNTRVWHCEGCGCGNGISVVVLGPDGAQVALTDPNALLPLCPDGRVPFEPAGVLGSRIVFTGTLYESGHTTIPTPTYPAPPGTYTVIAGFSYANRPPEEWIPVERRATFSWQP